MGKAVPQCDFRPADYERFARRLRGDLRALKQVLADPAFGRGEPSLGAELEIYLIDKDGKPLGRNREIQNHAQDPLLTLELNRFNLEYNFAPLPLAGRPFQTMEDCMAATLEQLGEFAAREGGRVVPIGILPTLTFNHFGPHAMTDEPRYHLLKKRLREIREGLFKVNIAGADELVIETDDITFEGANTSFQVHYKVEPGQFADSYNALQLVTPLVVALSCNSPTAFGQRLWHETRIPLFKKSIDCRKEKFLGDAHWHAPARVNYGHGWLREGAYELFAESVRLYPPLLPVVEEDEDPLKVVREGRRPRLAELMLHMGTVWLWNRPIYDPGDGGHLRIEMRVLPSGPTPVDMTANAALSIGLMEGLKEEAAELITALPFPYTVHNFYRAARLGLEARVIWPNLQGSSLKEKPVKEVLRRLLPKAREGLARIGIGKEESDKYLGVIEERLDKGITAARWQLDCYENLRRKLNDIVALHTMLESYYQQSRENAPVARWRMPG